MKGSKRVVSQGSREAPFLFGDAVRSYLLRRVRGVTTGRVCEALALRFGSWPAGTMTSRVVDDYATERMKVVSGATVRREVTTLMAVLKMAHLSGRLMMMPTVVRPLDGEPRLRSLSEAEVARVRGGWTAGMDKEAWRLSRFMLATGARVGEAVAMTWADWDSVGRVVTLRSRKGTGVLKARGVPVGPDVADMLGWMEAMGKPGPFG